MMDDDFLEPGDIGYGQNQGRGKYFGVFSGIVKDANDPERLGRVRVWVGELFPGNGDDTSQWTEWADPRVALGGSSTGANAPGSICVPPAGTVVDVEFRHGDPDFPVWTAGSYRPGKKPPVLATGDDDGLSGSDRTVADVMVPKSAAGKSEYPHNRMIKCPNGTIVELDETPDNRRVRVQHPSGSFIEFQHPGDVVKQVIGNLLIWAGGNMKVGAVSDVVLAVGGLVKLGSGAAANRVLIDSFGTLFNTHTHSYSPGTGGSAPTAVPSSLYSAATHTASKVRVE